MSQPSRTEQILDLARWAPSGDNTQPWRFEIVSDDHVVVHGFDTRGHCVYDLDGHPSQMALGALLETISIAATSHALRTEVARRGGLPEEHPTFDVRFVPDQKIQRSPLIPFITVRSVQRRPLRTTPLSREQKAHLEACVAPDYQVLWFETPRDRLRVAKLMFRNAKLRLTMPEAYEVHREVIEWNVRFSDDRMPDQALGVDPLTLKLMRWLMQSWTRVKFFNTWLGGTLMPRLQLELIPGVACAAHCGVAATVAPASIDDYVAAGRPMQRFWLEVTKLGLWLQPEMTPLIFGRYQRDRRIFTSDPSAQALAVSVASELTNLVGVEWEQRLAFVARVGMGEAPRARSTRIPLSRLIRRGSE